MTRWIVTALLLIAYPTSQTLAEEPLAKKIEAIIDGPNYLHANWGVLFVDAKSGEVVYARNPDKLFAPASVTKLYTCAAAMIALGADSRFETPVYQRGTVNKDGKLTGDLILVAQGDLTFGGRRNSQGKTVFKDNDHTYADGTATDAELTDSDPLYALKELAKQIKDSGIKQVSGDVLIDDRLFAAARGTGSGPAAISPMIVNDNVIDLLIQPGAKVGDPAKITVRPETAYLRGDMVVTTGEAGSKAKFTEPGEDPRSYVLRGTIPLGSKPIVSLIAVERPAEFARTLFIEALKREGIAVSAPLFFPSPTTLPLPEKKVGYKDLTTVATYSSAPLKETLKVTLKVSHNLYASTLPCLVAARKGKTMLRDGVLEQGKILKELGVDVKAISFAGGAGGSNADHVTPQATVQLLKAMQKRPDWAAYKECLPILGQDGTLATIVPKDSPAYGKVFAKTGTLYWDDALNDRTYLTSKALAGVMTTKVGRELVFAMFVNDVSLPKGTPTKREGIVLGKLCEVVHDHGE